MYSVERNIVQYYSLDKKFVLIKENLKKGNEKHILTKLNPSNVILTSSKNTF